MRLVFMGTPEAAVHAVRRCVEDGHEVAAVWTQPDRPSGRGNRLTAPPVKEFALAAGIPVHQPFKIRNDEALSLFRSYEPDAVVVVAYGRILPEPFLQVPPLGCINVHFSLLPAYRGAAPVNWAIVRGEHESGVSTMLMDAGLDTGPFLLQRSTVIGVRETAPELMLRLSLIGAELLSETLFALPGLQPHVQDEEKATYAPMLSREDGLIEWALDAFQIERRVRGFQPWPNAFTQYDSKRLVIWNAVAESGREESGQPGEVLEVGGDQITVACGEHTLLRIFELQPEGKRRMTTRDFLNGARVVAGVRFG
jgi:methionyl-tRNA formyltransferase